MVGFRALNPGCGCALASSELPNQWLCFLAFQDEQVGKKSVRKISKKFKEVDMMFAMTFQTLHNSNWEKTFSSGNFFFFSPPRILLDCIPTYLMSEMTVLYHLRALNRAVP
jgi:hypothetical protein